jgi:hypothetical protein
MSLMKKTTLPDFTNKVVSLGIGKDEYTYAINSPRFELQGNKLFLIGTVPAGGSTGDWCEGATSAVAWDNVTDYLVFDSASRYAKSLLKFKKHKHKHKA